MREDCDIRKRDGTNGIPPPTREKKRAHKAISQVNDSSKKEEGGEGGGLNFYLAPSFLIRLGQGRRIFSSFFFIFLFPKSIFGRGIRTGNLISPPPLLLPGGGGKGPFFKKVVPNGISRKFERGKSVDLLRLEAHFPLPFHLPLLFFFFFFLALSV